MRHQVAGRHLNRTSAHRNALRRNLAASLFEHGTISTTREKAKFVQPFAEKLITLAKDGSLHARRRAISLLQNRNICKVEDGQPVKVTSVISKLFSEIGPRFADRNGGYTRIINLPLRRIGDNGLLVLLQLVDDKKASVSAKKTRKKPVDTPPDISTDLADDKIEPPDSDHNKSPDTPPEDTVVPTDDDSDQNDSDDEPDNKKSPNSE